MAGFGGLSGILPIQLGPANGPEEEWTAAQHARLAADLVAVRRTVPIALFHLTVTSSGPTATITDYLWQLPRDLEPTATITALSPGYDVTITFPTTAADDSEDYVRAYVMAGKATVIGSTFYDGVSVRTASRGNELIVRIDTNTDLEVYVVAYGETRGRRTIYDYDGALDKEDGSTESPVSYAAQWYRDLQQQRGSLYSKKTASFVHAENLAIARVQASIGSRYPDRLRNNATPLRADDGIEYWGEFLKLARGLNEPRMRWRKRLADFYRSTRARNNFTTFRQNVKDLLGDAFVSITLNHDGNFESPSTNTYWPTINPGPDTYDMGGGAWLSDRAQITVNASRPAGMSKDEFSQLMNVQLFQLVDRDLPIWCTAQWNDENDVDVVWDGGSGVTWDSGLEWGSLFDWNA